MSQVDSKCVIQDRYFVLRSLSAISESPTFRIASLVWGSGFIARDQSDNPYYLDIPTDVEEVKGAFYRDLKPDMSVNMDTGDITITSTIAKGEIASNESHELSALYALDSDDNILVVFAMLPVWLSSQRGMTISTVIQRYATE